MRVTFLCLTLIIPVTWAADRPLHEAAREAATKLKAGGIVTAESVGNFTRFAAYSSPSDVSTSYSEDTLFEIGSITKVFTGLLLAQAVLDGKVTLDTTIAELLPDLKFTDPQVAAITLRQLSTHTSGLPRLPSNHLLGSYEGDPYAGYTEEMLFNFLKSAKLKDKPPYPSRYSNVGVGLLGHLLGKVYQMPWEEAVVKHICEPLGLHHTRMSIEEMKLPLAPPYSDGQRVKSWHFQAVAGAGALRSTAKDLLRFGHAIAQPEKTPLAKAFELALKPQVQVDGPRSHIGLGIFIQTQDQVTEYSHGGGTGGYRSALQVLPDHNIVRVVLINNASMGGESVIAKTRIEPPRVVPQKITLSKQVMGEYPGVYLTDSELIFTLLVQGDQLYARLTGQPFVPIYPQAKDQFFYPSLPAEIHFSRQDDKVSSLTLFQNRREIVAKRLPQPTPSIQLHSADELKPYTGTFMLMGLKELTISLRGSTLYAHLADQEPAPIFETQKDVFEFDVVQASLTFSRDDQGQIQQVTLTQNGVQLPAIRKRP
jgi:D-alanyl-D-alanine-carboxypeptidase/D-alanyl-D-alanine-endopeptidase